jgi:hypothetical protein
MPPSDMDAIGSAATSKKPPDREPRQPSAQLCRRPPREGREGVEPLVDGRLAVATRLFTLRESRNRRAIGPLRIGANLTGDFVHPNTQGYRVMGDAIDLKRFEKWPAADIDSLVPLNSSPTGSPGREA